MSKVPVRELTEVQMTFQLPPPVYCDHLTTIPAIANKNIKLVRLLTLDGEGLLVETIEGVQFNIPASNIRYWK
jgi:hypothetical protein